MSPKKCGSVIVADFPAEIRSGSSCSSYLTQGAARRGDNSSASALKDPDWEVSGGTFTANRTEPSQNLFFEGMGVAAEGEKVTWFTVCSSYVTRVRKGFPRSSQTFHRDPNNGDGSDFRFMIQTFDYFYLYYDDIISINSRYISQYLALMFYLVFYLLKHLSSENLSHDFFLVFRLISEEILMIPELRTRDHEWAWLNLLLLHLRNQPGDTMRSSMRHLNVLSSGPTGWTLSLFPLAQQERKIILYLICKTDSDSTELLQTHF